MLNEIAGNEESPLAKHTKTLFIGSVYDRRTAINPEFTVIDGQLRCRREEAEKQLRSRFATTLSDPYLSESRCEYKTSPELP